MIQNTEKPAVLVFYLSEFFKTFGTLESDIPPVVYNSPFYIYDQSFNGVGPKFEDEKEISDEDCNLGFVILRTIWKEYIGPAQTPSAFRIFKSTEEPGKDTFSVASTYGFVPGYDMDAVIETITRQHFTVIRWDEFWDEDSTVENESETTGGSHSESEGENQNITLLIKNDTADEMVETSFGGLPVKDCNIPFEWPKCHCGAEMQYQGKIKTDIGFEMIFMQNCDDWGYNKVIIVDFENLEFASPENKQIALRQTEYGVKSETVEADDYDTAREQHPIRRRDILGQINGTPSWLQDDETPTCDCCGKKMRFVAQLEEGPDYETAMNFGGGCGYLFDCATDKTAKFITQC